MKQWQGENDFGLFKASMPVNNQQIWQAFYDLHKDKVQVQKEKIAVEKLKVIVKATFRLSNQKGFALMSLRDLSEETGMSMGSLYAYIGSKGQLAEMIHQFLPHMFDICIGTQLDKSEPSRRQLEKLVRGHIFITECLQPWFFFAFMETKHLSRSIKELAKDNEAKSEVLLQQIIQQGELEKKFVPTDKFLTSMMIKNLLQSWYVKHAKYKKNKTDCESYLQFIEKVIALYLEISS